MSNLQTHLHNYINEPLNPHFNAELGEAYEQLGQGAAALSYFLRAAELLVDVDINLSYNCLLKTWKQVNKIGRRIDWERTQLQLATSYLPTRPESYLILSNNFNKIVNNDFLPKETEFKIIDEFEHNFISLLNGKLIYKDFSYEEKNKIFIAKQINKLCKKYKINKLALYCPINYELNILSAIFGFKIKKLQTCLPVIERNNNMSFKEWKIN